MCVCVWVSVSTCLKMLQTNSASLLIHEHPYKPFNSKKCSLKTPSGTLWNTVKLKTRIFQLWRENIFNLKATIFGDHKRWLRLFRHSRHETTMVVFHYCINRCSHMLLIRPWVNTFSARVNRAVRRRPVIGCDCDLHGQWSSEPSLESSCSITVSDTDQYTHKVPLSKENLSLPVYSILQTQLN